MTTIRIAQLAIAVFVLWLASPVTLNAQNASGGGVQNKQRAGESSVAGALAVLTPVEQQGFKEARDKALADDSVLATGEKEIRDLRQKVRAGQISKEDALARMRAHRDKMDAALLRAKPAIGPILEKLNVAIEDRAGAQITGREAGTQ